jgi:CRISPR-associated protein Cst2
MSKHLFGLVVTHHGTAANNRGETEGNTTTLQKLLWKDEVRTTVSAEAIRWAIRYYWQRLDRESVNRVWNEDKLDHHWEDPTWKGWSPGVKGGKIFADDDVLGFMEALSASEETDTAYAIPNRQRDLKEAIQEANDEGDAAKESGAQKKLEEFENNHTKLTAKRQELEATSSQDKQKIAAISKEISKIRKSMDLKGVTLNRRGALEVTRAISLSPFAGETFFGSRSGKKDNKSIYITEIHATRYQYGFAITPEPTYLKVPARVLDVVDAVIGLSEVGGNNSRFLFDFSPDSVVFRWTDDFAPRMLYGFEMDPKGAVSFPELVQKVKDGDINAKELFIGGSIIHSLDEETKKALVGAKISNSGGTGVKAAAEAVKKEIRKDLGLPEGK